MRDRTSILVAGATGYVGGHLVPALLQRGHAVRALARDPSRAQLPAATGLARGDVLSGGGLEDALRGVDVAFYLVHSMGGGSAAAFAERDRQGAENFGAAAAAAGVQRIVYLGGLEDSGGDGGSEHLRSRDEVARVLARHVHGTVHARAAMVIGAGSASFVMLRSLVERLPVMVVPKWLATRTQPIAVADAVGALAALAEHDEPPGEVQLGGADVLTYHDMMRRYARVAGRRAPLVLRVPLLSPGLSSYWVSLVTPVDRGLVRPLIDGLSSEMVVREPPPPGINDDPRGFDDAVRAAII